jgi:hypothetical protein
MNLVSLLILPAVISLRNNDGARYSIAGAALVVLVIAVAFSKRKTVDMSAAVEPAADAAPSAKPTTDAATPAPSKKSAPARKLATKKAPPTKAAAKAPTKRKAPAKKALAKKR